MAIVLGTSDRFHSRTHRLARSLVDAGYGVTILSRRDPGDAASEETNGIAIRRVPMPLLLEGVRTAGVGPRGGSGERTGARRRELRQVVPARVRAAVRRVLALIPPEAVTPGLARRFEPVAPRADLWHAVGLIALPVALRLAKRYGGVVVYDAVEIHVESGRYLRFPAPLRALVARLERRWAHRAAAVVSVGDPYAREITRRLGRRVTVIWNVPPLFAGETAEIPDPRLRAALGVGSDVPIVLYHGRIARERGLEQLIDAMADVPGAVLAVMGFGDLRPALEERAERSPAVDRIRFLDPVPPAELLGWISGADVGAMPIQATTLNHRLTTPNKLFEAIGAGVPVVVSDLPGMAPIVREARVGETCDPSNPSDIARAIRAIVELPPDERTALRRRCLAAARDFYNWESQADRLIELYTELGVPPADAST